MHSKILIIEDNEDIQSLLFDVLSDNYLVYKALDGINGVSEFKKVQPDLIILDLMLPQINGESVLKIIRHQSKVPIIVLTAIQNKDKTVAMLNDGANDYLTKPFDIALNYKHAFQCNYVTTKLTTTTYCPLITSS